MTTRLRAGSGQIICSRERTNHVLPTARGGLLDADSLSADPRAHRPTRGAPHVIAGPTPGGPWRCGARRLALHPRKRVRQRGALNGCASRDVGDVGNLRLVRPHERTQPGRSQPAGGVALGDWGHGGREATRNIVKLRRPPQGLSFWLGVMLMALSFGIYPEYLVVPFLPISAWRKGEVAMGLSAVSWVCSVWGRCSSARRAWPTSSDASSSEGSTNGVTAEREVEPLLLRALPRKRTSLP